MEPSSIDLSEESPLVSYDVGFNFRDPKNIPLITVYDMIRTGSIELGETTFDLKSEVELLRQLLREGNRDAYNKRKKKLPAVTLSGTFPPPRYENKKNGKRERVEGSGRAKGNVVNHSGRLLLDLDGKDLGGRDPKEIKKEISEHQKRTSGPIEFLTLSASAAGLKGVMRIPSCKTDDEHLQWWLASELFMQKNFGIKIDPATKDSSRVSFLTFDPEPYLSRESSVLEEHWREKAKPQNPSKSRVSKSAAGKSKATSPSNQKKQNAQKRLEIAVERISSAKETEKHETRLNQAIYIGGLVGAGYLDETEAESRLIEAARVNTADPKQAEQTIKDGLAYGKKHPLEIQGIEGTDPTTEEPISEADTEWKKRLREAKDFEDFREIYEEERGNPKYGGYYCGLLEFRGETWWCTVEKDQPLQDKVFDAQIRKAFTQSDETREFNADHTFYVRVRPKGEKKTRIVEFSADELVSGAKARVVFKQKADVLLLKFHPSIINALVSRLEREVSPVVRLVDSLGYDEASESWLFGKFGYTSAGQRITANSYGYFEEILVRCRVDKEEKLLDQFEEQPLKPALQLLHRIYGNKGIFTLGYYVACLFRHEFLKILDQAFPYLSLTGPKGSGKTTLITFCNQIFFQLDVGLGLTDSKANTEKGVARTLAKRRSLVIPYSEANGGFRGLSENGLLSGYHAGSIYTRAAMTNDQSTNSTNLNAGILFNQNVEPFKIGAVKERVVSLEKFLNADEGGVTEDTKSAMKELGNITAVQRAGLGHIIMQNLPQIQQSIFEQVEEIIADLQEEIDSPRVCFTHAVLLSGALALLQVAGFSETEIKEMAITDELVAMAQRKEQTSVGSNEAAEMFFDAFEALRVGVRPKNGDTIKLTEGDEYLVDDEFYWIRLTEVERKMREAMYSVPGGLHEALKSDDRFTGSNLKITGIGGAGKTGRKQTRWESGKKTSCWQFRREPE